MERAVIAPSLLARNNLLAMLSTADVLGRVCDDQQELLEKIDLYGEFCQEHQCWSSPYPFPSDHSRFEYFRRPSRSPLYEAYDDTQCEVILMSGLPGTGKDTYVQTHLSNWPVISLDALRTEMGISPEENQGPIGRRAREMAREYLRQQQNFVWNATNITRQMRHGLIDLFATYHARVRIIYVEVPWSELLKRNQRRSRPIPVKVIRKLADQLDVPDLSEAHQIDYLESA
jgi:predicted kinase